MIFWVFVHTLDYNQKVLTLFLFFYDNVLWVFIRRTYNVLLMSIHLIYCLGEISKTTSGQIHTCTCTHHSASTMVCACAYVCLSNQNMLTFFLFLSTCLGYNHYKNTPIQIYRKFLLQKFKIFRYKNCDIFHISARNIDCGY